MGTALHETRQDDVDYRVAHASDPSDAPSPHLLTQLLPGMRTAPPGKSTRYCFSSAVRNTFVELRKWANPYKVYNILPSTLSNEQSPSSLQVSGGKHFVTSAENTPSIDGGTTTKCVAEV